MSVVLGNGRRQCLIDIRKDIVDPLYAHANSYHLG